MDKLLTILLLAFPVISYAEIPSNIKKPPISIDTQVTTKYNEDVDLIENTKGVYTYSYTIQCRVIIDYDPKLKVTQKQFKKIMLNQKKKCVSIVQGKTKNKPKPKTYQPPQLRKDGKGQL